MLEIFEIVHEVLCPVAFGELEKTTAVFKRNRLAEKFLGDNVFVMLVIIHLRHFHHAARTDKAFIGIVEPLPASHAHRRPYHVG